MSKSREEGWVRNKIPGDLLGSFLGSCWGVLQTRQTSAHKMLRHETCNPADCYRMSGWVGRWAGRLLQTEVRFLVFKCGAPSYLKNQMRGSLVFEKSNAGLSRIWRISRSGRPATSSLLKVQILTLKGADSHPSPSPRACASL